MSEHATQNQILVEFGWLPLFRRNVGVAKYGKRVVRFGRPGMADLHGILPDGRAIEVEVKSQKGRQSITQRNWEQYVKGQGGLYVVARSPQDVWEFMDEHGYGYLRACAGTTQVKPTMDALAE